MIFITIHIIKFGIGRATYDSALDIRSGDLTREEGIALINKFDGEFPERWAKEIFEYLSIREEEFGSISKVFEAPIFDRKYYELLADKARSPHLWIFDENDNKWCLRETITEENQAISQEETAKYWQGNK